MASPLRKNPVEIHFYQVKNPPEKSVETARLITYI